MIRNKKINLIKTELFIGGRKFNISLIFITQSYFTLPKNIRLNPTHYFIMKVSNKKEAQEIAIIHSLDVDFNDYMNLYKNCTSKSYYFLVNDVTFASDYYLHFRSNLFRRI